MGWSESEKISINQVPPVNSGYEQLPPRASEYCPRITVEGQNAIYCIEKYSSETSDSKRTENRVSGLLFIRW
jgi:hypothetical protein